MNVPPNMRVPFWATRDFRWLIIVVVMGLSTTAVLVFEIWPGAADRKSSKPAGRPVTRPPDDQQIRFEGILGKVKDRTAVELQDEPYSYLIRHLEKADSQVLQKESLPAHYASLMKEADSWRGRTVQVLAMYLDCNPIRLEKKVGNVEWVYRTYLADFSATEGYVADLLERPPEASRRTLVRVDGIFLKVGTYEGRKGPVEAPLLLGRNMLLVKETVATETFDVGTLIVAVAVGCVLAALFLTRRILRRERRTRISSFEDRPIYK